MNVIDSKISKRSTVFFLMGSAFAGASADCLKDVREMGKAVQGAQSTRLRSYLCGTNGRSLLQLEFNRLNDLAMGLLLRRTMPEPIGSRWRTARIVENDVSREFNRLISEFGVSEIQENFAQLDIQPALPTSAASDTRDQTKIDPINVIVPQQGQSTFVDFPDPDALGSIASRTQIPPGYSLISSESSGTSIWRFIREDEVRDYGKQVAAYNSLILAPRFERQFHGFRTDRIPVQMRLYQQLGRNGLPRDFLFVRGFRNEGGCSEIPYWEFKYCPRQLLVNLVTVENVSASPLAIDGLLGDVFASAGLDAVDAKNAVRGSARNITGPLGTLAPGGIVLIPLSLLWAPSPEIAGLWGGTGRFPRMATYSWGNRLEVSGVGVGGQVLALEGRAANFLSVTTSCACGSCPYLDAWDSASGRWVNTGVMLEFANSPAARCVDWRQFSGAVLRFRLREDEAEITRIDTAWLEIEMLDGERVVVSCDDLARISEQHPLELAFNESAELTFELPPEISPTQVASTKLFLRGYYERYADTLAKSRPCLFDPSQARPREGGWSDAVHRGAA